MAGFLRHPRRAPISKECKSYSSDAQSLNLGKRRLCRRAHAKYASQYTEKGELVPVRSPVNGSQARLQGSSGSIEGENAPVSKRLPAERSVAGSEHLKASLQQTLHLANDDFVNVNVKKRKVGKQIEPGARRGTNLVQNQARLSARHVEPALRVAQRKRCIQLGSESDTLPPSAPHKRQRLEPQRGMRTFFNMDGGMQSRRFSRGLSLMARPGSYAAAVSVMPPRSEGSRSSSSPVNYSSRRSSRGLFHDSNNVKSLSQNSVPTLEQPCVTSKTNGSKPITQGEFHSTQRMRIRKRRRVSIDNTFQSSSQPLLTSNRGTTFARRASKRARQCVTNVQQSRASAKKRKHGTALLGNAPKKRQYCAAPTSSSKVVDSQDTAKEIEILPHTKRKSLHGDNQWYVQRNGKKHRIAIDEHESKHDEETETRQDTGAEHKAASRRRFNTIKLFGQIKAKTRTTFLQLCSLNGIWAPRQDIIRVVARGYRSKFDSRHLIIVCSHSHAAQRLDAALQAAQKTRDDFKKTHHTTAMTHMQNNSNYYAIFDNFPMLDDDALQSVQLRPRNSNPQVDKLGDQRYWRVATYNIQSVNDTTRMKRLASFIETEHIDLIALQETNFRSDTSLSHVFKNHSWYGSPARRKQSGVGFLIRTSLLENLSVTSKSGHADFDSHLLTISNKSGRNTCFMAVYGKSNANKETALRQWNSYSNDLQNALRSDPNKTDVVFLGDVNARVGRADCRAEEEIIGRYGEPNNKRNTSGKFALQFMQEHELVSLNGRTACEEPEYTFHSRSNGHSVIDMIAVSKSMWRTEYRATPIVNTLTGKEDHLPVVANIRICRRKGTDVKKNPKSVWNLNACNSKKRVQKYAQNRDEDIVAKLLEPMSDTDNNMHGQRPPVYEALAKIIYDSGRRNVGKIQVCHKVHFTRAEKAEQKLRQKMKSFCRKFKREIQNVSSKQF